jgi:hypothetical protein
MVLQLACKGIEMPVTINGVVIHSGADALNYKRPVLVRITGDEVELIGQHYSIELSRIKTRKALIEWIHHLLGKAWMTNELMEQFIEVVCKYQGWKLYENV